MHEASTKTICFADPNHYRRHVGGAEIQLLLLARAFFGAGWAVHYVSDDIDERFNEDGIEYHPCGGCAAEDAGYEAFREAVGRTGADIVYQRGRKSYTAYLGPIARDLGCKTVFSTSMDIDTRRLKETPRVMLDLPRHPGVLRRLPKTLRTDLATLAGMRDASAVLVQSRLQQRLLKKRLGIESRLIRNMHPLPKVGGGDKTSPPIVLWLANLKAWKRPHIFLEMVRKLADLDCRFVMGGRLESGSAIGRDIAALERADSRFEYIGAVPFERTAEFYGSASIFVNTSRRNEGVPNAFIQAWLAETPVISLEVDPDGDILRHRLGEVCGSTGRLAREIRRYVEDPVLRRAAGGRARAYAADTYGMDGQFPHLLQLVESLLAPVGR